MDAASWSTSEGAIGWAIRHYTAVHDIAPDDTDAFIYRGSILARLGQLEASEAVYRAGTFCTSGFLDEVFYNLGLVLRAQERFEEAADSFRRAIEICSDYAEARVALADVLAAIRYVEDRTRA